MNPEGVLGAMGPWVLSFLIGAIPTSYLLVKVKTGQDIRKLGSGNPGATNVFRCVGMKEGLEVLILDAGKGALCVLWLTLIPNPLKIHLEMYSILLGLVCLLGHVFTPFLRFRGGKGVAVGGGVLLAAFPTHFLISFIVWCAVLWLSRYMSLASISGAFAFSLSAFYLGENPWIKTIGVIAFLFIVWTHRSNIKRLCQGKELKFTVK